MSYIPGWLLVSAHSSTSPSSSSYDKSQRHRSSAGLDRASPGTAEPSAASIYGPCYSCATDARPHKCHAQIIEIARRWSGEIEEAGTGRQDVVRHYDTFRTSSLVSKMTIRIRDEGGWRGVDGASYAELQPCSSWAEVSHGLVWRKCCLESLH